MVGCGGGGGGGSAVPPTIATPTTAAVATPTPNPVTVVSTQAATATFTVSVPIRSTSSLLRSPKFVSPSTQSVLFTVQSVNGVAVAGAPYDLDVVATNPACTASGAVLTCTANLPINLPANTNAAQNAVIQVATYPQTGGQGPVLGQSNVGVTLYANAQNRISLTVAGVVAGFYLILSSQKGTAGTPSTSNLAVVPTDASGAVITGSGAFSSPIQLTTNNPHVLLSLNGGAGAQSVTVSSFTDVVQLQYDGNASVPFGTVTGTASGVSGSAVVTYAIARTALSLSAANGAPYINANGVAFDAPTETTSVTINGGLPPYTASSASAAIATAAISGSTLNVTAQAFGATSVVVTDAAGAQQTVIVAVSAPQLAPPTNFTNPNYNPTSGQFTFTGPGQSTSFTIVGGQPPFQTSSSNPSVISATQTGQTLSSTKRATRAYSTTFQLTTGGYGVAVLTFTDAGGKTFQIPAVVTATPLTAVGSGTGYANGAFTFGAIGATGVITPAAGAAPYSCASSATAVATVALDPKGLTCIVTTVGYGSAVASVSDSNGSVVPFLVTNSPATFAYTVTGGLSSYNATAKAFLFSGALGQTATFTLSGGLTPYTVTAVSSTSGAVTNPVTVTNAGGTYTLTTTAYGQSLVTITSANNVGFTIPVTVAPSQLQVGASAAGGGSYASSAFTFTGTTGQSGTLSLSGGAAPYTCGSASTSIATATLSGSTCTIAPVGFGTTAITVKDATGQSAVFNVQVTASTLGLGTPTLPIGSTTITISTVGGPPVPVSFYGGLPPYSATSSNSSVATATVDATNLVVNITAIGYGLTGITLRDSAAQQIQIPVSVNAVKLNVASTYTLNGSALVFPSLPQSTTLTVTGGSAPYTMTAPASVNVTGGGTSTPGPSPAPGTGTAAKGRIAAGTVLTSASRTMRAGSSTSSTTGVFTVTFPNVTANYAPSFLRITDAGGNTHDIPYSVQATGLTPSASGSFYNATTNAVAFTAPGQSGTITVSGGYPPYTYASANTAVATFAAGLVSSVGYGSTSVSVTDSRNNVLTIPVTVTPSTSMSISSSATTYNPSTSTFTFSGTGGAAVFTLSGGTGTYNASVTNTSVASISQGTGGSFRITALATGSTPIALTDGASTIQIYVVVNASGAGTLTVGTVTPTTGVTYAGSNLFVLSALPSGGATVAFQMTGGTAPYTAVYPTTVTVTGSSKARSPRQVTSSPTPTPTTSVTAPTGTFSIAVPATTSGANPYVLTITDSKGVTGTVAVASNFGALNMQITSGPTPSSFGANPARISYTPTTSGNFQWAGNFAAGSGSYSYQSSTNAAFATATVNGSNFAIITTGYGNAVLTFLDTVTQATYEVSVIVGAPASSPIVASYAPLAYASGSGSTLNLGATTTSSSGGVANVTFSGGTAPYGLSLVGCPAISAPATSQTSFRISATTATSGYAGATCTATVTDYVSNTFNLTINIAPSLSVAIAPQAVPSPPAGLTFTNTTQQETLTISGGVPPYAVKSGPLTTVSGASPTFTVSAVAATPSNTPEIYTDSLGSTIVVPVTIYPTTSRAIDYDGSTSAYSTTTTNYVYGVSPAASGATTPSVEIDGGLFNQPQSAATPTVSGTCGESPAAFGLGTVVASGSTTSTYGGGIYAANQTLQPTGGRNTCSVTIADRFGNTFTYTGVVLQASYPAPTAGGIIAVDSSDPTGRTIDFSGTGQTFTFSVVGGAGSTQTYCATASTISSTPVTTIAGDGTTGTCTSGTQTQSSFTVTSASAGTSSYLITDATSGAKITMNFGVTTLGLNVQSVRKSNAKRP